MDHPDFPKGFKLPPKKKKGSKSEKREKSSESGYAPSVRSTNSRETEPRDPYRSPEGHAFAPHPAVNPVQPGPVDSVGYSWRLHPQEDYGPPERKRTLLSKKSKPLPIRSSSIRTNPQPLGQLPQRSESRLTVNRLPPPLSPNNSVSRTSTDDSLHPRSISQPSTPSWYARGKEAAAAADLSLRVQSPLPALPHETGQPRKNQEDGEDMALFAAATAGLSPEQPLAPGQRRVSPPQSLRPRVSSSSSSYIGRQPPSPGRHYSSSSSSRRAPSISTSSFDNEICSNSGTHQEYRNITASNPDLARKTSGPCSTGPALSRWATQSSLTSSASGDSTTRISVSLRESSKSLDVARPSVPSISVNLPPYVSPLSSNASPQADTQWHDQMPGRTLTSSDRPVLNPRTSSTFARETSPARSPVSPASPVDELPSSHMSPWLHENVSALSIDTTVNRTPDPRARFSAISSMSAVSDIDPSEISPLDPEDDFGLESERDRGPLPDYKTSQEEMAMRKQTENERRAQELQRRWAASTRLNG